MGGIVYRSNPDPIPNELVVLAVLLAFSIIIVIYSFRLALDKKQATECIDGCHQMTIDILCCLQQGKFNPDDYPMKDKDAQKLCCRNETRVAYPEFLREAIETNTQSLPSIDKLRISLVIGTAAVSILAELFPSIDKLRISLVFGIFVLSIIAVWCYPYGRKKGNAV